MKKIFSIILVVLISIVALVACTDKVLPTLSTPTGVALNENGLITWNAVENATAYIITISGEDHTVTDAFYQVELTSSFSYYIVAIAEGYQSSAKTATYSYMTNVRPDIPTPDLSGVVVAISGGSEIRSGHSIKLNATVSGTDNNAVVWKVTRGSEYASIDKNGTLTAETVTGDKIIEVVATSAANEEKTASRIITVLAKPTLTQNMLDALDSEKMTFDGYVNISLYTIDAFFPKLHSTYSTVIKTAMDGTNWYAEYEDGNTGITNGLYFKKHNDLACQVGVSFMNEELYTPMLDKMDNQVSWIDGGLYNSMKTLTINDFTFDEDNWRYTYSGADENVVARLIAGANPYDFVPMGFSLIIEDDEILGIYSMSEDDYTLLEGYRAVQELTVALNVGEDVKVPVITKYTHEDIHDDLQLAIDNMRALESYTLDFKEITSSYLTSGYVQSGFIENITADDCYFTPYSVSYDGYGKEVHNPIQGQSYGYHKVNDSLYNAFYEDTENPGRYEASRAYATEFSKAKPSFAFAAEIFRSYYHDEDADTTTYYVDSLMSSVASTFYYGVGNDINLYGIFATEGYTSATESFTPFVVIKDGYIVEACFYYYLGSMFGVVELSYGDFNETTLPDDVTVQFEARNVPVSWSELNIEVSGDTSGTADDYSVNALEYLKTFFEDEEIEEKMPFFGIPLGDTYGFGLTSIHIPGGERSAKPCITFYYDVPLDIDYSINSSLNAIGDYLEGLGYTKNQYDEYSKDGIIVAPVDSSLDLLIYVWKQ